MNAHKFGSLVVDRILKTSCPDDYTIVERANSPCWNRGWGKEYPGMDADDKLFIVRYWGMEPDNEIYVNLLCSEGQYALEKLEEFLHALGED